MKPIRYYVIGGITAGLLTCVAVNTHAQTAGVPRQISYQGVLCEGDKVSPDGMYSVTLALYDKATGGQPLWQETQTVEVKGGLFNIILGQYVPLSAPLPTDAWIGISFNSMGEMPRTKLTSVPYAFNAVTAQSLMPNATGAVLSLNGQQGAIELRATDGFEVRSDKGVLTIGKTPQNKEDETLNQGTEWVLAGNGNANANSWLGTNNNIPLIIRTNNTERMRILSSNGNVGIGETNPSSRLSVARTLHITNTGGTPELKLSAPSGANSTTFKTTGQSANITYTLPATDGNDGEVLTTDGTGQLTWEAAGWSMAGNAATSTNFLGTTNAQPLIVKTNNVERYRVTSGGAMGINEDNPTQKLEVGGNILVKPDGSGTGELRIQEQSGGMGNNYTGFKAGNLPVNVIYTLPTTSPLEGQVLSSNTQGILSWITPSTGATGTAGGDLTGTYPNPTIANNAVDGTKVSLGSDANGDMMYYNGTDYVRLPIGSSGEILTVSSGIPTWSVGGATGTAGGDLTGTYPNPTIANDAVTTAKIANNQVNGTKIALGSDANGDMMYYNGTDYVRLPIGSSGQQLIVSSGIPAWSAPTILSLPTTTVNGTAGVIRQNSQVIYHSYGNNATFFGEGAGNAALATSTTNNVGIGYYALNSNVGNQNTAVGVSAMSGNSSGGGNTAIGFSALSFGSSGNLNSAFGQYALVSVNGGNQNVGLGYQAGNYVTTGSDNVYVGANSGSGGVQTTGSNNTFLGASTGQRGGPNTSFSSVTLIGYNSNMGADNLTNATAIGANAVVSTNNSLVLGNTNVNVGIGTSAPGQKLDIANGNVILSNSSGSVGSLRFQEQAVNGSNYVGFRAPNSIASDVTWTLPDADGTSGQVLTTNGSGLLSWVTPSVSGAAGGDLTGTYPNPTIANDAVTTAKISSSGASSGNVITYNGTNVVWAAPSTATTVTNSTLAGDGSAGNPLRINLGNSNTWTANQTFASTFLIASNTRIALTNSDNNGRDIRWQEPSGTGTQYIGWRAPTVTNNGNYVFPATVGSVGQVLGITTSNGIDSARTSWVTPTISGAAGGDLTGTYPNPTIANDAVTTAKIANNQVNGTKIALGSDANGDIMYYNGTDYTRRAIGTDGQVLTVSGGVPTWANPSGGADIETYNITSGGANTITISNTNARFHRLDFGTTMGSGTTIIINLASPSSYNSGTQLNFFSTCTNSGGLSPTVTVSSPSGQIYLITSGAGNPILVGTLTLFSLMTDGTNYYRVP